MHKKPLVSVIVPLYNTQKYLHQCLESLVNQTLSEIEIICIDDGSSDDSLKILQSYAQKDIRIKVLSQNHKRQGAARNLGIKTAQGEYIGFVDSDDYIEKDMFENLYKRAKQDDTDITLCSITVYNEKLNTVTDHDVYASLDIFPTTLDDICFEPCKAYDFLFRICVSPCNKIFKTSFLKEEKIEFPEVIYFEDNTFFFKSFLKAKRINLIRDCLYHYRMYSQTSTCFGCDENKIDIINMLKLSEQVFKDYGLHKRFYQDIAKNKKNTLLYWYKKIQDKKVKQRYYIKMLFYYPFALTDPIEKFIIEMNFLLKIMLTKNKKIAFWGASLFLTDFIKKYKINNKNIAGIIDRNPEKFNTYIGPYKIYSPEQIKDLEIDEIIISIVNFAEENRLVIEEYMAQNNSNKIKLETVCK